MLRLTTALREERGVRCTVRRTLNLQGPDQTQGRRGGRLLSGPGEASCLLSGFLSLA